MATSFKRTVDIAVKVTGDSQAAINRIGENLKSLDGIVRALQGSAATAVTNINNISAALGAARDFKAPELNKFRDDIKNISKVDPKKIEELAAALKSLQNLRVPSGFDKMVDSLIKLGSASKPPDYTKFAESISKLGAIDKFPSLVSFVNQVGRLSDLGPPPDVSKLARGLVELGKVKELPKIPAELVKNIQALAGLGPAPTLTKFVDGLKALREVRLSDTQINALTKLTPALSGLSTIGGVPNLRTFAAGLQKLSEIRLSAAQVQNMGQLAPTLQAFSSLRVPNLDAFIASLEKLGQVKIPSLKEITTEVDRLASAFAKLTASSPLISTLNGIGMASSQVSRQLAQTTQSTIDADTAFGKFGERIKSYFSYRLIADSIMALKEYFSGAFAAIKDYSQGLKDLQAITLSTDTAVAEMAITIQKVASNTKFSTTEVAEGMKLLAQAGLSTDEAIASMEAVSNLATGTLSTMATTVDLVTTAMRVFNIDAKDTSHLADVFANAVNRSKLTVDKLRTAMNYVGPVAASVGVSVEETSAAMMTLANSGLRASTIGTGLRRVLSELASPSLKLARAAEQAGVDLRALDPTAHSLNEVFSSLSLVINDTGTAFDIFGKRGAASALAITNNMEGSFAQTLETVDKFGTAAEMAQVQMEGLGVSYKNLQDKMSLVAVAIGEAGLIDALGALIDSSKSVADALEDIVRRPGTKFVAFLATAALSARGMYLIYQAVTASLIAKRAAIEATTLAQGRQTASEAAYASVLSTATSADAVRVATTRARIASDTALQAAMGRQIVAQRALTAAQAVEIGETEAIIAAKAELALAQNAVTAATAQHIAKSGLNSAAIAVETTAVNTLVAAEIELAAAQEAVTVTSKLMWLTNPVVLFTIAVTTAVAAITLWTDSTERSIATFRKLNDEINTTRDSVNGYVQELKGLQDSTVTEEKRLEMMDKLSTKYPELTREIYATSGSVQELITVLERYKDLLNQRDTANLADGAAAFGAQVRELQSDLKGLQASIDPSSPLVKFAGTEYLDQQAVKLKDTEKKLRESVTELVKSIKAQEDKGEKINWRKIIGTDDIEGLKGSETVLAFKDELLKRVSEMRAGMKQAGILSGSSFYGLAASWKVDLDKAGGVMDSYFSILEDKNSRAFEIVKDLNVKQLKEFADFQEIMKRRMLANDEKYEKSQKTAVDRTAYWDEAKKIREEAERGQKEYTDASIRYKLEEARAIRKLEKELKDSLSAQVVDEQKAAKQKAEIDSKVRAALNNLPDQQLALQKQEEFQKTSLASHQSYLKQLELKKGTLPDTEYDRQVVEANKKYYSEMKDSAVDFYNRVTALESDRDPTVYKKALADKLQAELEYEQSIVDMKNLSKAQATKFAKKELEVSSANVEAAYASTLRKITYLESGGVYSHAKAEKAKLQATMTRQDAEVRLQEEYTKSLKEKANLSVGTKELDDAEAALKESYTKRKLERAKDADDQLDVMYKSRTALEENFRTIERENAQHSLNNQEINRKQALSRLELEIDNAQKVTKVNEDFYQKLDKLDKARDERLRDYGKKLLDVDKSTAADTLDIRTKLSDKLFELERDQSTEATKLRMNREEAERKHQQAILMFNDGVTNQSTEQLKLASDLANQYVALEEAGGRRSGTIEALKAVAKLQEQITLEQAKLKKKEITDTNNAAERKFLEDKQNAIQDRLQALGIIKEDHDQRLATMNARAVQSSRLEDIRHKDAMSNLEIENLKYLERYALAAEQEAILAGKKNPETPTQGKITAQGTTTTNVVAATEDLKAANSAKDALTTPAKLEIDSSSIVEATDQMLEYLDKMYLATGDKRYLDFSARFDPEMIEQASKDIASSLKESTNAAVGPQFEEYNRQIGVLKAQLDAINTKLREADIKASAELDVFNAQQDAIKKKLDTTVSGEAPATASGDESKVKLTAFEETMQQFEDTFKGTVSSIYDSISNKAADSISDGFADWITGAKNFQTSMRDMANAFVADLGRMIVKALVFKAVKESLNSVSFGFSKGGLALGFAGGGRVAGPGTGTSDSINAKLSNGEYVMTAQQTSQWLPVLEIMRQGKFGAWLHSLGGYAKGGLVAHVPKVPNFASGGLVAGQRGTGQGDNIVSVEVNYTAGAQSGDTSSENVTGNIQYLQRFGKILSDLVTKEIINQQRPGGLLSNA